MRGTAIPGGVIPGISQIGPLPDQAESTTEWVKASPPDGPDMHHRSIDRNHGRTRA